MRDLYAARPDVFHEVQHIDDKHDSKGLLA
jgi:hypothetical protein